MMNLIRIGLSFAFFLAMINISSTYAYDVIIDVTGNITGNTCTVSSESESIDVDLGVTSSRTFAAVDDIGPKKTFSIKLTDCDSSFSGVKVMFDGTTDDDNQNYLKLNDGGSSGLAIQILDESNNVLPLKSWSSTYGSSSITSLDIIFYARYVATNIPVTSGSANAVMTFLLEYP